MVNINDMASREIMPGAFARFIHGEHSTLAYWEIKQGSVFKEHAHFHEQIIFVIKGEMEMMIGNEKFIFTKGSTHVILANTPHSGAALTDCEVIDCFNPARDDYR
jgi:quercetin dioxygenase-like cupin family protein